MFSTAACDRSGYGRLRATAGDCGRLRATAGDCGRLRMVMAAVAAIAADVGIGLLLFTCASSVYPLLLTPDGQADRITYHLCMYVYGKYKV